jgi:hypothetical protein
MRTLTNEELGKIEDVGAYQLPWGEFVQWALYQAEIDPPDGDGLTSTYGWRSPAWELVRLVKSRHPQWNAGYAWRRVNSVVENRLGGWERRVAPSRGDDDYQADFYNCWEKCQLSGLRDPLSEALRNADAWPVKLEHDRRAKGYGPFLSFCGHLVLVIGKDIVALPCRKLGKVLTCRPTTICVWIQWAVEDNFLKLVKQHQFHPENPKASRAAEYRVATTVWKMAKVLRVAGHGAGA